MKVAWIVIRSILSVLFFWAILSYSYDPEFKIIVSLFFMILSNQWGHQALNRIQFSSLTQLLGRVGLMVDKKNVDLEQELDAFKAQEEKGTIVMAIPAIAQWLIYITAILTIIGARSRTKCNT